MKPIDLMDDVLLHAPWWMQCPKDGEPAIALSGRVRLSRNLEDTVFPGRASESQLRSSRLALSRAIAEANLFPGARHLNVLDMRPLDWVTLEERRLLTYNPDTKYDITNFILTPDQSWAIGINEYDHLYLQAAQPGLDLKNCLQQVFHWEAAIGEHVSYAFDEQYGYLTVHPGDMGTGMRASVIMHLPALVISDQIEHVSRSLTQLGLMIHGISNDDQNPFAGNLFVVSNRWTLGIRESAMVERLTRVCRDLIVQEKRSRQILLEDSMNVVCDLVSRAYGVLTHAYQLHTLETWDMLSALWLGVDLGMIQSISVETLQNLIVSIQPGHLQQSEGKMLSDSDCQLARARLIHSKVLAAVDRGPGTQDR